MIVELEVGDELSEPLVIKEFNYFDNIPIAMESSTEQDLITWDSIKGGDIVKAEVESIENDSYIIVKLNSFMKG